MRGLTRALAVVIAASLPAGLSPAPVAQASVPSLQRVSLAGSYGSLQSLGTIRSLKDVAPPPTTAAASGRAAFHVTPAHGGGAAPRGLSPASPPVIEWLRTMSGVDESQQVTSFGADQAGEPPDTQLAARGDILVEATNSTMSVWSRSNTLIAVTDLNQFFGLQNLAFSDPRILYDPSSDHWFLSGFAYSPTYNVAMVAESITADPTGGWDKFGDITGNRIPDQPKLAVTTDKVVLSWNSFTGSTFDGAEAWVIDKADMVPVSPHARGWYILPDPTRAGMVPVVEQTPESNAYLVYNGNDLVGSPLHASTLRIMQITGTPEGLNMATSEVALTIQPTSNPPPAAQAGTSKSIQTNDDRFLSAELRDNTLWISGNDACLPSGDTAVRACLRLIQTALSTAAAAIVNDFDVANPGEYEYFPAVVTDAHGNLFVAYTSSSGSANPTVEALSLPSGASPVTSLTNHQIALGRGVYDSSACGGTNRWGDYSGAAIDTSNPNDVWVAGEYTPSSTNSCDWGTAFGLVTVAPPTATSIYPSVGPTRGGTTISVFGTEFALDATSFSFDGVRWTQTYDVRSGGAVDFSAPPHACGLVPIVISTADGSTLPVSFQYLGYPCPAVSSNATIGFRNRHAPPPTSVISATPSTPSANGSTSDRALLSAATAPSAAPGSPTRPEIQLALQLVPAILAKIDQELLTAIR